MNISAPFILRPIATALLMVGLLVGGLVGYPLRPVAAVLNANFPTLQVTVQQPGTDPQTMASSVATPLDISRIALTSGHTDMLPSKFVLPVMNKGNEAAGNPRQNRGRPLLSDRPIAGVQDVVSA